MLATVSTAKPRRSSKPATVAPLQAAIATYQGAHAALYAPAPAAAYDDETEARLASERNAALARVAEVPCASDAEFIAKLRFLFAEQLREVGQSPSETGGMFYEDMLRAIELHLASA
ncbi:hypothetical protein [Methylosinus sp. PW1]|uniref:hypothetical protein n=1 Tax=Methylosinus sp. PW1 TaxID=107636 RepID=UPI000559C35C|nr:hypothetical protein [Methylosinus sp. PW1]